MVNFFSMDGNRSGCIDTELYIAMLLCFKSDHLNDGVVKRNDKGLLKGNGDDLHEETLLFFSML